MFGRAGFVITGVLGPDTKLHAPVPTVGAAAPKVAELVAGGKQASGPAFAIEGASSDKVVIVTVAVDGPQINMLVGFGLVTVQLKT